MASPEQIRANRSNSRRSTGPHNTERTRLNGLKHGLRAEQVVLPGEDPAGFDAELQGWRDDWRPRSHTAAAVCERAAVANWKLRRATRVEAARLHEVADAAAHEFDAVREAAIGRALRELHADPGFALSWLTRGPIGLDALIGMWEALALAAADPSGWTSRPEHHDRLLALLGHPAGSAPKDLKVARSSAALLAACEGGFEPEPGDAVAVRLACAAGLAEARRQRSKFSDPPVYRQRAIDQASAPVTKEAQLLHRYEMAHENALYAAIRHLTALAKSDADRPDEAEAGMEAAPGPEAATAVPSAAVAAAPAGPVTPEKTSATSESSMGSGELASVGAPASAGVPSEPSPGAPGGPGGPAGADPGPRKPPRRS